jgi:arabinogalactan oligomer/maltooligosaccharide transport system permease protein
MALTDFSVGSIRDGLNGGIWREVWFGITGQVIPVQVEFFRFNPSTDVHYAGPSLLIGIISSLEGASLLVFEILWTLLSVGLQTSLGLSLAIVLDRYLVRFRKFWLTLFILPWAIPEFVGVFMWLQILDPRFGWFVRAQAEFSQRLDFPTAPIIPAWGENPGQALLYLLIPAVWYGFPFMMLAATAGLKMIPADVYEAAAIDGASGWQRFQSVTWPLLFPLIIPAVIIRMIFAFNQFYIFTTFQTPFPVSTFATTSYYFFADGGAYALSAVLNIVTILILIVGILFFNRLTRATSGLNYAY